jgi:hypothetical protein
MMHTMTVTLSAETFNRLQDLVADAFPVWHSDSSVTFIPSDALIERAEDFKQREDESLSETLTHIITIAALIEKFGAYDGTEVIQLHKEASQ